MKTRNEQIHVRLSADEKEKLQQAADDIGLDLSTFVRMAAIEKAVKQNAEEVPSVQ
jgi:uncharacterized protein (DUF1778 family)